MNRDRLRRLFGIGPVGASLSLLLLAAAMSIDRMLGHPKMLPYGSLMKGISVVLVLAGLGLSFWTMYTLRNWWVKNRLCTRGPFRWFRHPMYAGWITFVSLGAALYSNSWTLLLWVISLHLLWHRLVRREEKMMVEHFPQEYPSYATRTGRFIPRL